MTREQAFIEHIRLRLEALREAWEVCQKQPNMLVPDDPARIALCQGRKAEQLARAIAAGLLKGEA